ncbi:hemolysin family protein [Geoalkalibacter sp.]|uniref:hemolysin family protein n=1 Tax=Geoalkalibacter sp. TaxID=3041440 RepID=UPI00272E240E|nr:hemolysin family protein [Geoalkalibacter sp.]
MEKLIFGKRRALTEEDLQNIIDESEEEGIINEGEGEMLHSIFEFGDTVVREIMVPRTDMVCCPTTAGFRQILNAILTSGHSRIPIYEGSPDRIVGVVYAKDLLRYWGRSEEDISIPRVMRTPFFVPETKNVQELLQDFRSRRVHLAIAVDEYGGTSGLITIEDLIEEIVGDIQDEYDLEEEWLQPQEDGSVLVDCRLNIEEFEEYFSTEVEREKFDTVAGYVFNLLGRVPHEGEEIRDRDLLLTVTECDTQKIRKVRVRRVPLDAESNSSSGAS